MNKILFPILLFRMVQRRTGKIRGIEVQIDKLRGEQLDQLFDAILSLKTREECYQFLMILLLCQKSNPWHNVYGLRKC